MLSVDVFVCAVIRPECFAWDDNVWIRDGTLSVAVVRPRVRQVTKVATFVRDRGRFELWGLFASVFRLVSALVHEVTLRTFFASF